MKFSIFPATSVNITVIVLTRSIAVHDMITNPFTNVLGAVAVLEGPSTIEFAVLPSAITLGTVYVPGEQKAIPTNALARLISIVGHDIDEDAR